jgi:hypothetical protein
VIWWGGAAALAALFGGVWWLRRQYLVVTIFGRSMLPTYADRDRVPPQVWPASAGR